MQRISLNINLSKIDKKNLFKGEKGTYLDATLVLNDQVDEYGNNGFIAQVFLKDNRKDASGEYVKTPVLGNAKIYGGTPSGTSSDDSGFEEGSSDLPF